MEKELILKFENSSAEEIFEFEAWIDVNEYLEPAAAEVFYLAHSFGKEIAIRTTSFLKGVVRIAHYDPDVDALTFSFGEGTRYRGTINGWLHVGLSGGSVVVVKLFKVQ